MNETLRKAFNVATEPTVVTGAVMTSAGVTALYVPVMVTGTTAAAGTAGTIMIAPVIAKAAIGVGVGMMVLGMARSFMSGFRATYRPEGKLADQIKDTLNEVAQNVISKMKKETVEG